MTSDHGNQKPSEAPASGAASAVSRLGGVLRSDARRLFGAGVPHVLVLVAGTRGVLFVQQIALARILTPDDLGRLSYVIRLMMVITVLADLGMCTGVFKYASEPISDAERNDLYRTGVIFGGLASLVLATLFALVVLLFGDLGAGEDLWGAMLLMALFIPASALAKTPPLFLQARKEIKKASAVSMATSVVGIGVVIGGTLLFGLWGYFVAAIMAPALQACVFLKVTWKFLRGASARFATFTKLLRFGSMSILANFSGTTNAVLGVLMLKWLKQPDSVVAVFAVATSVHLGVQMLPQSLLQTAFPYLSQCLSDPPRLRKRIHELAIKQTLIVGGFAVLLAAVGYWLIPFVFGAKYVASFRPAVILTAGLTAWSVGSPFGRCLMILDRVHLNLILSLVQLAISAGLCVAWIPSHGASGAAMATATATAIAAVLWLAVGSYELRRFGAGKGVSTS